MPDDKTIWDNKLVLLGVGSGLTLLGRYVYDRIAERRTDKKEKKTKPHLDLIFVTDHEDCVYITEDTPTPGDGTIHTIKSKTPYVSYVSVLVNNQTGGPAAGIRGLVTKVEKEVSQNWERVQPHGLYELKWAGDKQLGELPIRAFIPLNVFSVSTSRNLTLETDDKIPNTFAEAFAPPTKLRFHINVSADGVEPEEIVIGVDLPQQWRGEWAKGDLWYEYV